MTSLRVRFERRTGVLVGTYHAHSHWSRYMPIYIGPVGSWGPNAHGYWRQWGEASGASISTFGHAAYIVVARSHDGRDRVAFWAATALITAVIWIAVLN